MTETISGEFNAQEEAKTMWVNVTKGRKPGERVMGQLERRAEKISGEFDSGHAAKMARKPGRKPGSV